MARPPVDPGDAETVLAATVQAPRPLGASTRPMPIVGPDDVVLGEPIGGVRMDDLLVPTRPSAARIEWPAGGYDEVPAPPPGPAGADTVLRRRVEPARAPTPHPAASRPARLPKRRRRGPSRSTARTAAKSGLAGLAVVAAIAASVVVIGLIALAV